MKPGCDIIQDLIPLVNDGVASEESRGLVEEHCAHCVRCAAQLRELPEYPAEDEQIIKTMRRRTVTTQLVLVLMGAGAGAVIAGPRMVFYNLLIMPLVGGLSYAVFRRKWYLPLLAVFVATAARRAIPLIRIIGMSQMSLWNALAACLVRAAIYTGLMLLGMLIALLIRIALDRPPKRRKDGAV